MLTGQKLDNRGMEPLSKIPIHGFVNGIAMGPKARYCVVAVGQEPRLGRWNRVARAKNRFGIVRLRSVEDSISSQEEEEEEDEEREENEENSSDDSSGP